VLLALDTSTPLVSVALADDTTVVHEAVSERPMQHGEQLAPMIDAALSAAGVARSDLEKVAAGVGPGPFTGLRVGLVTARTLGLALGIPVVGVGSLDALALQAVEEGIAGPFLATIDARRKELFWAEYDERGRRLDGPHVDRPVDLPTGRVVVGAGPDLYPSVFERSAGPTAPEAGWLARGVVSGRIVVVGPEPVYLRRPDAAIPGPPKKVS
jgi:tRNA threonylcarbamoyl adenosine modification protein YeaZ